MGVYARGRWLWFRFKGPDGEWYDRSAKLQVGQEALAQLRFAELVKAISGRAPTAPAPLTLTVADFAETWSQARIASGKFTNAGIDARAFDRHVVKAELQLHGLQVAFGRLRLDEVRVVHVRAWLAAIEPKRLAANTVISLHSLLNRMFKAALRQELITVNPCQLDRGELPQLGAEASDGRPEEAMFSLRELEQLLSDARVPLDRRVTYAISCLGSPREGELSALLWSDYDETQRPLGRLYVSKSYTRRNKRVKSTKTNAVRWVPVHPVTAALLAEWKLSGWAALFGRPPRPGDLLVPNRRGKHLTDLNVLGNLKHDFEVLGWRARTFHDTRATFCTYAVAAGAPWELVKHISHGVKRKSRQMSAVYVRPPWEVLCGIVSAIKLELRAPGAVVPLRAVGALSAQSSLQKFAAMEATTMETNRNHEQNSQCPGRDSNSPADRPGALTDATNRGVEVRSTPRFEGEIGADCSESAAKRRLRPLVGGRVRPFRKTKSEG